MNFINTKNRLTAYALACGYIEKSIFDFIELTLWHEHGVYRVRAHDFDSHGRLFWESFAKLTDARRFFDLQTKQIKQGVTL